MAIARRLKIKSRYPEEIPRKAFSWIISRNFELKSRNNQVKNGPEKRHFNSPFLVLIETENLNVFGAVTPI